jgi:hypothetical protein
VKGKAADKSSGGSVVVSKKKNGSKSTSAPFYKPSINIALSGFMNSKEDGEKITLVSVLEGLVGLIDAKGAAEMAGAGRSEERHQARIMADNEDTTCAKCTYVIAPLHRKRSESAVPSISLY